ncbi:MAG: 3'-5' exonuclease [Paludibacter sp.]
MLKPKITKEEVNQMPVILFEGKITLVDDVSKIQPAIKELRKASIVGIDTETKPSFTRGTFHKVSLVQISTTDHCFLFRLNYIGLPVDLAEFLADEKIMKIGLSLRDDLNGLNKLHKFRPGSCIDIQNIVKEFGILELGLQKIYALLFGKKISKSQRLTNWESQELTEQQQRYAATDAWASLEIYLQLMKETKLTRIQLEKLLFDHAQEQKEMHEQRIQAKLLNSETNE